MIKISQMNKFDYKNITKTNFASKISIPTLYSEIDFFANLASIDNGKNLDFSIIIELYF